jgi:enterochelin esterase-like enzyme
MKWRLRLAIVALLCMAGCAGRRCTADNSHEATRDEFVIPKIANAARVAPPVSEDDGGPRPLKQSTEELTWTFEQTAFGRIDVVVVLPDRLPNERFPVLIALHGRGEAMKGPVRGARGWVDDYALGRAIRRLSMPPLQPRDFEGLAESRRIKSINEELRTQSYQGLVVICPYTPDVLTGERPFDRAVPYVRFLVETLLPRARRELPVIDSASATGIDGVSLGGRLALLSGLYDPKSFGAVATLQAAFDSSDAARLAGMAADAKKANPSLKFRLLTSDEDYFLNANRAISAAFKQNHVEHLLLVVTGPHDYIFNRGPGAIEMLLYHDRALREPSLH